MARKNESETVFKHIIAESLSEIKIPNNRFWKGSKFQAGYTNKLITGHIVVKLHHN